MNNEIIEIGGTPALTFTQRWNTYLAIALAGAVLFIGITMRNKALNATQTFEDLEAGIRAQVPNGWLVSAQTDEYVFRAEDPNALPFKTLLQVSVMTVGQGATPNTVLDLLTIGRSIRFATYIELSRSDDTLRDGSKAKRMKYAYVEFERNPFLQSLPVVVEGVDVVVLRGSQAVIITYREERNSFDEHLYRFENMLRTLEIF
jgi:hypothetical protein